MTIHTRKIAVDEFWDMAGDPDHRYELIDGEPVDTDGAPLHGRVTGEICRLFEQHVEVDVIEKSRLYVRQGVSTVLPVEVYNREVAVGQSTGRNHVLTADDVFTGAPCLPGFSCPVGEIFSGPDRAAALRTEVN